jgi:hypothetical protein
VVCASCSLLLAQCTCHETPCPCAWHAVKPKGKLWGTRERFQVRDLTRQWAWALTVGSRRGRGCLRSALRVFGLIPHTHTSCAQPLLSGEEVFGACKLHSPLCTDMLGPSRLQKPVLPTDLGPGEYFEDPTLLASPVVAGVMSLAGVDKSSVRPPFLHPCPCSCVGTPVWWPCPILNT